MHMYFRERQILHSILEYMQYVYFRQRQIHHSILECMQFVYFRQKQIHHSILKCVQSLCTSDGGRFAKSPWHLGCSCFTEKAPHRPVAEVCRLPTVMLILCRKVILS